MRWLRPPSASLGVGGSAEYLQGPGFVADELPVAGDVDPLTANRDGSLRLCPGSGPRCVRPVRRSGRGRDESAVAVRLGVGVSWQMWTIALAVATFAALRFKVDVLWVVLAGGVVSVIIGLL